MKFFRVLYFIFAVHSVGEKMKIKILLILWLCVFILCSCAKKKEVAFFENNYKGLRPGNSTLKDAIEILGREPNKIEKTSNGSNYHFENIIINISGIDQEHINTISFLIGSGYTCPNEIAVGESVESAKSKISMYKITKNSLYDTDKGIFYWYDKNGINKIVLVYKALK